MRTRTIYIVLLSSIIAGALIFLRDSRQLSPSGISVVSSDGEILIFGDSKNLDFSFFRIFYGNLGRAKSPQQLISYKNEHSEQAHLFSQSIKSNFALDSSFQEKLEDESLHYDSDFIARVLSAKKRYYEVRLSVDELAVKLKNSISNNMDDVDELTERYEAKIEELSRIERVWYELSVNPEIRGD